MNDAPPELGRLVSEHRIPDLVWRQRYARAGVKLLPGAALFGFAVMVFVSEGRQIDKLGVREAGVPGALLLAWGGLQVRRLRARRGERILLHENGLLSVVGATSRTFPWEEISCLFEGHSRESGSDTVQHSYTLERRDGDTLDFWSELDGAEALGNRARGEVLQRRLPPAAAALARGETVEFRILTIDREGLAHAGHRFCFVDLASKPAVRWGALTLVPRGTEYTPYRWTELNAGLIPNLAVLLALIDLAYEPTAPG